MTAIDYAATAGTATAAPAIVSKRAVGPDILRALAILMVLIWHLPKPARVGILADVRDWGWLGVDVFFVLSGYLIGRQLLQAIRRARRVDFADFYLRRGFRILPAFLVVLAVYALIPSAREGEAMAPLWRFLTFTMNLGLDYARAGTFSSAWSLCVEEHFYLVAPLILLAAGRVKRGGVGPLIAAALIVGGIVLRGQLWLAWDAQGHAASNLFMRDIYYPTWTRIDGLVLGVLLATARLFRPELVSRFLPAPVALIAAVVTLAAALALIGGEGPVLDLAGASLGYPLFALGCAFMLSAALDAEPHLARLPFAGAVTGLAAISYSLYLTHKLVFQLDKVWLGAGDLPPWAALGLYLSTSLAAAVLLWLVVERPFLRLRDRVLARRH